MGLLIAVVVMLRVYDGKPLSEWPYSITINALVAILVTLIKATMTVPLAEGLSQLKWSWFDKPARLQDLALIDAASRGTLGAGTVVFSFLPRYVHILFDFV